MVPKDAGMTGRKTCQAQACLALRRRRL